MGISSVTLILFLCALVIILALLSAYDAIRHPDRAEIRKKLSTFSYLEEENQAIDILRKRKLSGIAVLDNILMHVPGVRRLDALVLQSNSRFTVGFYMSLSLLFMLTTYLVGYIILRDEIIPIALALLAGVVPFLYLLNEKNKRMKKFQRQLPEALELIARALRAGHAFSSGMKLAADEFSDPIGPEFAKTIDEINFGANIPDALRNLTTRVDCPDLKFFVVSTILHRETGGNLAEIIESIARLIRERFKFYERVRVLTAEAKLSAIILAALPFLVIIGLFFSSPGYIDVLFSEPAGRVMAGIAAGMMAMGIAVMKRIASIEV